MSTVLENLCGFCAVNLYNYLVNLDTFEKIKNKYGDCGSWAIWAQSGDKPKSNIGDLTVLDPSINKKLLSQLKPEYVFVGLNFSSIDELVPFANFHSPSPKAQDFKIRFALRNTDYWGSYMTDIIKNFEEKKSNKMMDVLNEDKNLENRNIEIFLEEIESLGVPNKKIIAFGGDTYKILERNLKDKHNLVKVTHYSHFISKENYRYELAKI